jgi:hypothetical protein
VLAQVPSWNELLGVALVIVGVAVHREREQPEAVKPRVGALRQARPAASRSPARA